MKTFQTLRGFVNREEPDNFESSFNYSAILRISSKSGLDFDKINTSLGLIPTKIGRRGDRSGPLSPPRKDDIWFYQAPVPEDKELYYHIDALWDAIKPHAFFLRNLKADAQVDVFLGYSSNVDHAGLSIPHKSLEMFTTLEIELSLSIIVIPDE